jgi:hypothetical protein
VNLDWKLSDATELHFRTFYENTENEGGRFRNRIRALSRSARVRRPVLSRCCYKSANYLDNLVAAHAGAVFDLILDGIGLLGEQGDLGQQLAEGVNVVGGGCCSHDSLSFCVA